MKKFDVVLERMTVTLLVAGLTFFAMRILVIVGVLFWSVVRRVFP